MNLLSILEMLSKYAEGRSKKGLNHTTQMSNNLSKFGIAFY